MLQVAQEAAEPGWWQVVPAVVQSVFWIVVGSVTVLTYRHARRTVLQPLRTEFFKHQIEELAEVLQYFIGLDETALRERADYKSVFDANVIKMFDSYAIASFGLAPKDFEARPYAHKYCPRSIFRMRKGEDFPYLRHVEPVDAPEGEERPRPDRDRHAEAWKSGYRHYEIHVSRGFGEFEEKMKIFSRNPYMPLACVSAIEATLKAIQKNLFTLADVIEECSSKMAKFYPTEEELGKANTAWIHNVWNGKMEKLDSHADAVILSAREHLASDGFLGLREKINRKR